ncbi:MAG TPA: DEAD/DEAH box helicase [Candidatus Hydrogenedentes bacterium]|nr:DEAD/DEAH box helicase [Candidatus Hydrogenedentota bacterium]
MALNPIAYTEKVVRSFLKYQLTAYPFADPRLHQQMRHLLNMDEVRRTPLLKGPYISLSRSFREGASVTGLAAEGVLHPHMRHIIPPSITNVYGHQERAIRAVHAGKTTLVSTGTGSGKTECFLYPIISKCLELRDSSEPAGISAVIVYPMNALAEDQLERIRGLLAGSGVTFGMYVGKTPEHEREVGGRRLKAGSTRADYEAELKKYRDQGRPDVIHPFEEVCSRESMRTEGRQPRILLTNVKQLELLLTRQVDVELFDHARLDYIVFDEAHTFTGIQGAETACLIRRLRKFCGRESQDTVCVATSATIVDERDPDAARKFAARFFGVQADLVECVHEEYQDDIWGEPRTLPPAPGPDERELLARALDAVDAEQPDSEIRGVYQRLTGLPLEGEPWQSALHEALLHNELAYQLCQFLQRPWPVTALMKEMTERLGRALSEEELLTYFALGAAAFKDGRPVFRPVLHGFIRGISGAVVTFPKDNEPQLWLSSEDEIATSGGEGNVWRVPIYTCTTCGQHYFVAFLKDFEFTRAEPGGGELAEEGSWYWATLDKEHGGCRVVLVDQVLSQTEDDDLEEEKWSHPLYFCRHCGSAHPEDVGRCQNCGAVSQLVKLFAIRTKTKNLGNLSSCVSCKARGRQAGSRFREPIRPVRAVNVADVHVLAQDMVHHAERPRLLLFADNRQDAAFQAGWMKDHARRFRLRRLMADAMKNRPVSIGDMAIKLDDELDKNEGLSRALIPEVWRVVAKEGSGGAHEQERRHFLRIQVLREVTTAANQRVGLEPWGRLRVSYSGLDSGDHFFQEWSNKLGLPPEDLKGGVEAFLDQLRRQRLLYDNQRRIFSRYWNEGDREIQRGYLPHFPDPPQGMKLMLDSGDDKKYVRPWLTERNTLARQIVRKWGVPDDDIPGFLESLWDHLRSDSVGVLCPVKLTGSKGKSLPNCSGVYQIDATKLLLSENHGYYRCLTCRKKVSRRTPNMRCMGWYCDGEIQFVAEDPENYDLQLLDQGYSMLRPEEHTAMVPQEHREYIENLFKGAGDSVNTLVCTPTLELGVDIGALDSVLLRNVPPLPANYWQRAGRAGRRHRMAVSLCYCRPASHDRAYYSEPLKMLEGRVEPPAFNLRNEVMVGKHVHACVITRLFQLGRAGSGLPEDERRHITDTLRDMLPTRVSSYLFEPSGQLRVNPFEIVPLRDLIMRYEDDLVNYVCDVFHQGWPATDAEVTSIEALGGHVAQMPGELAGVLSRLRKRLLWAHSEIRRLNQVRAQYGTLDEEDDAHYRRCDRMIKKLKGVHARQRREAEGIDDINTYGVFAAEGFLPGYGLDTGSVVGMAEVPYWQLGSMDFDLPRPTSIALREYVPGNLIYANGHRFVARRFHRDPDEQRYEMPLFEVTTEREAVAETNVGSGGGTMGSTTLRAISVCDVDLVHQSQISDEEETRFQMPVAVYGREKGRHNGGQDLIWGGRQLTIRRGVYLRLVNVGSGPAIEQRQLIGYPICAVCGQSVSPLASDRQIQHFLDSHEERCGRKPEFLGLFADVVADCLALPGCSDRIEAYSVLETLRMGAAHVLDMHLEDLQILVIGHVDRDEVDALLWDPMPGGSGLLDQIRENFAEVIEAAAKLADSCPSACEHSCIDCLQTFRNAYYHRYLDRSIALQRLNEWESTLQLGHDIPPSQPAGANYNPDAQPVNDAETKLKHLLEAAGFASGEFQQQIRFRHPIKLDHLIGSTTPDVYFAGDEDDDEDKGVCVYLDGMSASLHGDPAVAARDREIRTWLRNNGYQVIEITVVELDDREAMVKHFRKLAKYLSGKDMARRIGEDTDWFDASSEKQ